VEQAASAFWYLSALPAAANQRKNLDDNFSWMERLSRRVYMPRFYVYLCEYADDEHAMYGGFIDAKHK